MFFLRNLGNLPQDVFGWDSTVVPRAGTHGGTEIMFSFLEGIHTVVGIVTRSTSLEMQGLFIISLVSVCFIWNKIRVSNVYCMYCVSLHMDLYAREEVRDISNVSDIILGLYTHTNCKRAQQSLNRNLNKWSRWRHIHFRDFSLGRRIVLDDFKDPNYINRAQDR
jgi:hypothetical protein